jgi:hypothetical protein
VVVDGLLIRQQNQEVRETHLLFLLHKEITEETVLEMTDLEAAAAQGQ